MLESIDMWVCSCLVDPFRLQWIARLWLVRWISGLFLTVIVCCVSPQSRGNLSVDPRDREGQLLIGPLIRAFSNILVLFVIPW